MSQRQNVDDFRRDFTARPFDGVAALDDPDGQCWH